MESFVEKAQHYVDYQQNHTARQASMFSIPLLIFSLMILLGFVKIIIPGVYATSLACLVTLGVLIYYFRLHWQLALVITPMLIVLLWLAHWFTRFGPTKTGVWAFVVFFVAGGSLQLYSYFIETKKPAFGFTLSQVLIAPLLLTAELMFKAGYMPALKAQIYGIDRLESH